MFDFFKKKKEAPLPTSKPLPQLPEVSQPKPELKTEMGKIPVEQRIEILSSQIEAMNERLKNIERMVEEIYRLAKS